jgi:hypothetical protein
VLNTHDVSIRNVAVDAGKNKVTSCTPGLAAVHFHNASGLVADSAIFGATLANHLGCAQELPFGNGFGVQVDSDVPAAYSVTIQGNTIHDYTANGVLVQNQGVTATIKANSIAGVGPSGGAFQFGIFIANGAVARISENSSRKAIAAPLQSAIAFSCEARVLRYGTSEVARLSITTSSIRRSQASSSTVQNDSRLPIT